MNLVIHILGIIITLILQFGKKLDFIIRLLKQKHLSMREEPDIYLSIVISKGDAIHLLFRHVQ